MHILYLLPPLLPILLRTKADNIPGDGDADDGNEDGSENKLDTADDDDDDAVVQCDEL